MNISTVYGIFTHEHGQWALQPLLSNTESIGLYILKGVEKSNLI